jgi:hypothetical protein
MPTLTAEVSAETLRGLASWKSRYPTQAESAVEQALCEWLTAERCLKIRERQRERVMNDSALKCPHCGRDCAGRKSLGIHRAVCPKNPRRGGRWAKTGVGK